MPFTPTTWTNGVTAANSAHMTNTDTQYTEATNSFEQDLFTAFVLTGGVATKDGSIATQLDVTQCTYFALQSDSTLRRRVVAAANYTTSTPSTTYYLDFNPDQTVSWATSHSGVSNYLPIAQVTTDGSGNIATVTDKRSKTAALLATLIGLLGLPPAGVTFDHTPIHGEAADALTMFAAAGGGAGLADIDIQNLTGGWLNFVMQNATTHIDQNGRVVAPALLLASGNQIIAFSFFFGTGSGTFNHGLGTTPQWVGITETVLNSTMTVGVDNVGSTTVHVNTGTSSAWFGLAIA